MQAERMRVLELVQNGTITIEQGNELIDALYAANQPNIQTSSSEFRMPEPPRPPRPPRVPRVSGGGKFSFEQMIELGMHGVDLKFVRELADAGLKNLNFDEVVQMAIHGIKADYVIEVSKLSEEYGFGELTSDRLLQFGIHGIKPNKIREMLESGMFDLETVKIQTRDLTDVRAKLEQKRLKLEAKRDKINIKLDQNLKESEREKLLEMLEEINDEITDLDEELTDLLETEIEQDDE